MKTIYNNITKQVKTLKEDSKYNFSRIMRRARFIYLNRNNYTYNYTHINSWGEALKESWKEAKKVIAKIRTELKHAVSRLANCFNVDFSPEYKQNEIQATMMNAYNKGINLNK